MPSLAEESADRRPSFRSPVASSLPATDRGIRSSSPRGLLPSPAVATSLPIAGGFLQNKTHSARKSPKKVRHLTGAVEAIVPAEPFQAHSVSASKWRRTLFEVENPRRSSPSGRKEKSVGLIDIRAPRNAARREFILRHQSERIAGATWRSAIDFDPATADCRVIGGVGTVR